MAPKRKVPTKPATPKKQRLDNSQSVMSASSSKLNGVSQSVNEVWSNKEYVEDGAMTQAGFARLCDALGIAQMSFEAVYLMFTLSPTVDDVMIACPTKSAFQRGVECLGSVQELSAKLRIKRVALQSDFGVCFRPFFAWLFEMGRKITAMNSGACPTVVRSVPCKEGLQLMGAVLGSWPLLPKFIQFCETVFLTPFSKDLWMQIGRFVEMTSSGQICGDLSNYDDELTGGGSAWPCMIDDFVEFAQKSA